MIISREKVATKVERIQEIAATDRKALELMRRRGQAFTVPAFVQVWLEVLAIRI